jgi:hypothetical protein
MLGRLALNKQNLVQQRPGAWIDKINMTVDTVIDAPWMKQVTHLQTAPFDQVDALFSDDRLWCHSFPPGHVSSQASRSA